MKKAIVVSVALIMTSWASVGAQEGTIGRIGESGEFLELEHRVNGQVVKNYLPLHRSGGIRYFSAGVGLEERQASYPPFTLKLVFTAGGKPFLSGVDVTIKAAAGGPAITIPREQVEGPWLFVDLPAGRYGIAATYGGRTQELKPVVVTPGKPQTLYLRWSQESAAPVKIPSE